MAQEQFTQVKRPASRLTEKILGWLSWIILLILTIITMFIALVSFSNDTSIANLENSLNGNDLVQQLLTNNNLTTMQFIIWLQNGVWAIIVYFIICLLISFLALISMNIRILSGILFLISAIITIPLVLLIVTLIIPILFFIIAIMMFVRRDKVETVPVSYVNGQYGPYEDDFESDRGPKASYYDYEDEQYGTNTRYYNNEKRHNERSRHYNGYDDIASNETRTYSDNTDEPLNSQSQTNYNEAEEDNSRKDRYNQFPKRAVESEYRSTQTPTEEEPQVLSRQAKYSKKSNRHQEADLANQHQSEPDIDPKELKAQQKREKAEIRAKKKEKRKAYNKRMKEKRKNQPSAVSQRRMNFEERRQISQSDMDSTSQEESTPTSERDNHKE